MRTEIDDRFRRNLERVDNLIVSYQEMTGPGRGRSTVATTDLLRSAVVFLHATLEDVIRSVLVDRWPTSRDADLFQRVPFMLGDKRLEKITLGQLAEGFGGQRVDEILHEAVEAHLEHSNFNDIDQLVLALRRARLETDFVDTHASELQAMMLRRHWIVHRADHNDRTGSGQHGARSLGAKTVRGWRHHVQAVCEAVVAQLP